MAGIQDGRSCDRPLPVLPSASQILWSRKNASPYRHSKRQYLDVLAALRVHPQDWHRHTLVLKKLIYLFLNNSILCVMSTDSAEDQLSHFSFSDLASMSRSCHLLCI